MCVVLVFDLICSIDWMLDNVSIVKDVTEHERVLLENNWSCWLGIGTVLGQYYVLRRSNERVMPYGWSIWHEHLTKW